MSEKRKPSEWKPKRPDHLTPEQRKAVSAKGGKARCARYWEAYWDRMAREGGWSDA